MRNWKIYRCIACGRSDFVQARPSIASCVQCGAQFQIEHDILDTLTCPTDDAVAELKGYARERGLDPQRWREAKIEQLAGVWCFAERVRATEHLPGQYYQQTMINFEQALDRIITLIKPGERILEIGAENDYPLLLRFRSLGLECFALNIYFSYAEPDSFREWPEKTLGDMNNLPYVDAVFDFVLLSATTHHSPDLGVTISELARVLKPGGVGLILNDPLHGLLKSLGGPVGQEHHGRDVHIHENQYTISHYRQLFRRYHLRPEYLFSAYHDNKLLNNDIHPDIRFSRVARLVARVWRFDVVRENARRYLLWPGQFLVGLPLNVILRKQNSASARSAEAGTPMPRGPTRYQQAIKTASSFRDYFRRAMARRGSLL